MALSLTLVGRAGERGSRTLTTGTLSVGRAASNDWVLSDPERLLSKTHCVIAGSNGRYMLTDLSTNGVFVNGASERVPRGGQTPLNDGDEIRIGDYVITVAEVPDAAAPSRVPDPLSDARADPLGGDPLDDPFGAPPPAGFRHPISAPQASARPSEDPFDLFDSKQPRPMSVEDDDDLFAGIKPADNWHGASQPDNADAPLHAFSAPPPVPPGEIDFDALLGDLPLGAPPPAQAPSPPAPGPATAPPRATPSMPEPAVGVDDPFAFEPATQPAPHPAPPPPASAQPAPMAPPMATPVAAPAAAGAHAGADGAALVRAFLEGAGVPDLPLGSDPEAAMRAAGEVFRAMVEGIRDVLISRAAVKNEFRVEQTMLRARDNNALKFSVTPEDALSALLQPARPGYMPPVRAAREAFDDVRAHEMAVMAAVQTALLKLLKRFEPESLEKRLQPGLLGNLLPGARKARTWEMFCATWRDIAREAEDDFQAVFGTEFARAYDAQLRKL
jgi:type VI secretion system protein